MDVAPKVYLVCYDICEPRRLRKVYQAVRSYGERMQYSVFRCVLNEVQLARLVDALVEEIKHDEDQVLIVTLGAADAERSWAFRTLGLPPTAPPKGVRQFCRVSRWERSSEEDPPPHGGGGAEPHGG